MRIQNAGIKYLNEIILCELGLPTTMIKGPKEAGPT